MKLAELQHEKSSVKRLINTITFNTKPQETRLIQQHLKKRGINPTLSQVRRHLLQYLFASIEDMPEPERTVILRYQNAKTQH